MPREDAELAFAQLARDSEKSAGGQIIENSEKRHRFAKEILWQM
jgi:hypothetical protein